MGKIKIGARLKGLREAKGVSQIESAKELGVSKKSISCYENDATTPPLEMLEKLAVYYKTSIDYIVLGKEIEFKDIKFKDINLLKYFEAINKFDKEIKKSIEVVLNGFILGYSKESKKG